MAYMECLGIPTLKIDSLAPTKLIIHPACEQVHARPGPCKRTKKACIREKPPESKKHEFGFRSGQGPHMWTGNLQANCTCRPGLPVP